MHAVVQDAYGTAPDAVLRVAQAATPVIADDDVLVHVGAASVDRGTGHIMSGMPYVMRLAGFGIRAPKFMNPGRSAAGTVVAVGRNVAEFSPGDEVYGTVESSLAEYARGRARRLAPKPANLSLAQAAAVPVSGLAALHAVRDQARVQPGQQVLVIGATGGVGTFAVQLAKAYGAEVTATSSPANADLARTIGADHVVDYTTEDFADGTRQYDVILDIVGNRSLADLRRALTERGTLVIVGGEFSARWFGMGRQVRARLLAPFIHQRIRTFISSENARDLNVLRDFIEAGHVMPVIDRAFTLRDAVAAVRYQLEGKPAGKVVVTT
jgi:NADPH:quinone reductase-like Zn-dependent oxidoreductase